MVRPLLRVRRSEVEGFLRERGQAWREDSSNRDLSLMRNRVRHELMPVLRGFNPGVDELVEQEHGLPDLGELLAKLRHVAIDALGDHSLEVSDA